MSPEMTRKLCMLITATASRTRTRVDGLDAAYKPVFAEMADDDAELVIQELQKAKDRLPSPADLQIVVLMARGSNLPGDIMERFRADTIRLREYDQRVARMTADELEAEGKARANAFARGWEQHQDIRAAAGLERRPCPGMPKTYYGRPRAHVQSELSYDEDPFAD